MASEGATSCENSKEENLPNALLKLYPLAEISRKNEALVLAAHVLMLETGFLPADMTEETKEEVLPKGWNKQGYIKIDYSHHTCRDSPVQVPFVGLGSSVVIHGSISGTGPVVSLSINAQDYISSVDGFSDPKCVYKDFQKFSQFFKDNFLHVLLAQLQDFHGIERTFGLSSLPTDMKFQLLTYLPLKSLVAMSSTNKEFYNLASSSFLWKKFYLRDFPDDVPSSTDVQHKWKELYAEVFKRKKAWKKRTPAYPSLLPPMAHRPYFNPYEEPRGIRRDIRMPPELQEAFPYLGRRFRSENPILRHIMIKDPGHPLFRFL